MKKTLYIAAAVIAVMFAASCQKDNVQAVKKGMTLSANVEETKATITDNGDKTWKFSWELNDVVSVTSPSPELYSFVYDGTSFKCETAVPEAGKWEAVYPMSYTTDGISFLNQDGTLESAMKKYLLTGSCTSDGSATLKITMKPQVAILKVINNSGVNRSLFLKLAADNKYFTKISNTGNLENTNMKNTAKLIELPATPVGGEYYIVIPVPDAKVTVVTNGSYSTGNRNVSAGKVYNVNVL